MRRRAADLAALALLLLFAAQPAAAQTATPRELLARGLQAYQDLDFEAAANLIRTAAGAGALDGLPEQRQAEALTYLGAADRFLGNVDSTFAVFRTIVARFPLYRIDELVFPPEVSSLFTVVRRRTPSVAVRLPAQSRLEFEPGQGRLSVWIFPSTTHDLVAEVVTGAGDPVRSVYTGPVGDSLELRWDGRDATGTVVVSGAYTLNVQSRGASGRVERLVQIPLDVEALPVDTLLLPGPPADSLYVPERRAGTQGYEALLGGVLAGTAVAVLPSILSSDAKPSGARFAVGAAISAGGILGFFRRRPGAVLVDNVAFNESIRQAWRDSVDVVTQLNVDRRRTPALVIRVGALSRVELGG